MRRRQTRGGEGNPNVVPNSTARVKHLGQGAEDHNFPLGDDHFEQQLQKLFELCISIKLQQFSESGCNILACFISRNMRKQTTERIEAKT